jgi:nicotinate-nucleotide adenylyltransferase
MRVALFGGSFNPPHVAHQLTALYVLETHAVDQLWLVPTFQHPFGKVLEAFEHRFRMCELAVAALGPRVSVSDVEARLAGPNRTLLTVRKLIDEHPRVSFSLVIGSDLVAETETWYGSAELLRLVPLIVVGRGGHASTSSSSSSAAADGTATRAPLTLAMPAVSSTEIRAALRAGRDVGGWVPKSVLDYIAPRGLYGSPPSPGSEPQQP